MKDHYEQRIKSLEEDLAHLNDSLAAKDKQCEEVQMLKKIDNDNYVKETASYKDHMSSLTKQLVGIVIIINLIITNIIIIIIIIIIIRTNNKK